MLKFPFAVDLYVIIFVPRSQPMGAVALAKREWPEEIPTSLRSLSAYLDDRIHHVVLRKADTIAKAFEQLAYRRLSAMRPLVGALPDAVFDEQRRDHIRIVIIVAH